MPDYRRDFIAYYERLARAFGFVNVRYTVAPDGDVCLDADEFSFVYGQGDNVQVLAWAGAWPFAEETVMGEFDLMEDAMRYAVWLMKREMFYHERDRRMVVDW